jgi:hypothetical protein
MIKKLLAATAVSVFCVAPVAFADYPEKPITSWPIFKLVESFPSALAATNSTFLAN